MTVQLPSGNGVFPPKQRWDDNRDITGHQVPPAGCVLARKSLVASVVGDVPATTKQKHPGEGMEYCHGLRAGGLHLWQDEIQKANCRFDRIEQESDKKLLLSSELKHSVKYEIDAQPRRGRPRSYPTDKSWTGSFEDGDAKEWFKTSPAR